MELAITERNTQIPRWLEDYIEKKVAKLERYLPSLDEGRVEVSEEETRNQDQRFVVQVTLYDKKGTILRGEERAAEIRTAVDLVVDKLHTQISRFKSKRTDRYQRAGGIEDVWGEALPEEVEEEFPERKLVRTKRFAISPMDIEEAIEQMELLGHNFFVYFDGDSGAVQVVYRRRDGNYGLIIPDLA